MERIPYRQVAAALAFAAALPAAAQVCKPVTGHFEAAVLPPAECEAAPPLICTTGRVWGGVQGDYQFVMSGTFPAFALGGIPSASFFAGKSVIELKGGGVVQATDSGTLDFAQGGFASLITFDAGASGQIRLRGQLDLAAGITRGDYVGTFCN